MTSVHPYRSTACGKAASCLHMMPSSTLFSSGSRRQDFHTGSAPWSLDDSELNDWNGGRGVYFKEPNGHVLELMTVPQ